MEEIVDILKNRDKYKEMGATLPKGILLTGQPGTGKTMLAKALANEAGCTFIATSASNFEEIFVGVGSGRIKKLFKTAKKEAPTIIFIDEFDSIGGRRAGTDDMHLRASLNQLLSQMDGYIYQV